MVDEQTKIWAAGFFDGEGSLVITKPTKTSSSYILHTAIGNTVREAVDLFQIHWGGSLHTTGQPAGMVDKRGVRTNRTMWQVIWDESGAYKLIVDLLPYTRMKRAQFEFAKVYIEKVRDLRSLRPGNKQTGIEKQYRKEAYQIMKQLNEAVNLQETSMPISNTTTIPKLF